MSDIQFQYLTEKLLSEYGVIFVGVIITIVVIGIFGVRIIDRIIKIIQMKRNGTKEVSIRVPHDGSQNGKRALDNIEEGIKQWGTSLRELRTFVTTHHEQFMEWKVKKDTEDGKQGEQLRALERQVFGKNV